MIERFEDIAEADKYSFILDPFSARLEDVKEKEEELIEIHASIIHATLKNMAMLNFGSMWDRPLLPD